MRVVAADDLDRYVVLAGGMLGSVSAPLFEFSSRLVEVARAGD